MSSEYNAQGIEKEDKEAIADKQRPPKRLAAEKAIHRIREQSEMSILDMNDVRFVTILFLNIYPLLIIPYYFYLIGPGECHKLCNYDVTMCAMYF